MPSSSSRPPSSATVWSSDDRTLRWDGCVNVRDLGGHPTEDGALTHYGAVVRADSVRGLSEAGWSALVEYGVRTIVDLRWDEELEEDPPLDVPAMVVHISLLGDKGEITEVDDLARVTTDPVERKVIAYGEFLARYPSNFARAVAAVARAPEGSVAVHCAGGVDRTGLVVALLLRLAGVPREHVAADYAVSEGNWAPFVGAWMGEAEDDEEREHRRLLALCPAEAMLRVLTELEEGHGSVPEYLRSAGATDAELERARARLR